jgi:uncharacterized membrane protein
MVTGGPISSKTTVVPTISVTMRVAPVGEGLPRHQRHSHRHARLRQERRANPRHSARGRRARRQPIQPPIIRAAMRSPT